MRVKSATFMMAHELNDLVNEHILGSRKDMKYDFELDETCASGYAMIFNNIFTNSLDSYEEERINEFLAGDDVFVGGLRLIKYLVNAGVLPEGTYVVENGWSGESY